VRLEVSAGAANISIGFHKPGRAKAALSNETLESPKGNLEGPHQQFTLQTNDQLFDPSRFRKVIVAYQNGAPVTVGAIGEVIHSSTNPRTGAWFDRETHPSELLLIERAPGANTVQLVDKIKSVLPQLLKSIPPLGCRPLSQQGGPVNRQSSGRLSLGDAFVQSRPGRSAQSGGRCHLRS
jgi:multidrug efflux pump subunit AcrB